MHSHAHLRRWVCALLRVPGMSERLRQSVEFGLDRVPEIGGRFVKRSHRLPVVIELGLGIRADAVGDELDEDRMAASSRSGDGPRTWIARSMRQRPAEA